MYGPLPLIVLPDFCCHNWPDLVGSWGSDFLWHVKVKTITTTTRSKQNAFWKGVFSIMLWQFKLTHHCQRYWFYLGPLSVSFYNLSALCNKHQVVSHICNNKGKKFSKLLASDFFIARLFFKIFSNLAPKRVVFFKLQCFVCSSPRKYYPKKSKYWKHHFPHKNHVHIQMYVWQIKVPANEKLSKLSRHSTRKSNSKCVSQQQVIQFYHHKKR